MPIDVGSGPVVLLVHGQPGSGSSWWPVAELLREEFRVIAPDRPGWGSHPRPATSLEANAVALVRMLNSKGIEAGGDRIVVVGHSLGGGIAIELALKAPELVGALVLVGSVGVPVALTGTDRLLAVPLIGDGVLRAGTAALRRAVSGAGRLSRLPLAEPLSTRANRYPALRAVMAEGAKALDARDRRSFLVEQRALIDETPLIYRQLGSLRVPSVVIQGTADHIVPAHAAAELAAAIPGAELVQRERAGHRLAFEDAPLVAEAVRRYSAMAAARDGQRPPTRPAV